MVTEQPQQSFGSKALSTTYKVSGWHLRYKAIGSLIFGVIFLLGGIVAAIVLKTFSFLVFSGLGVLALLASWFYWHRSKSLVQGRFY